MNPKMTNALAQGDHTPVVLHGVSQEMIFEGMQVEIIEINGEPYFEVYSTGMALGQVKEAKGHKYPRKDRIDENIQSAGITTVVHNGQQYISEEQLYDLMLEMKTDKVKPFRKWVTSKVLPSIRKTGSYSTSQTQPKVDTKGKEIEARLINAKVRQANMYLKIAEKVNIPTYKDICYSKATESLSGEALLPLPKAERKTYSAGEIGEKLGITAHKVGSIANKYNLKTEEYGLMVWDKSKYSNKQVETWRYYDNVIPVIERLIEEQKGD